MISSWSVFFWDSFEFCERFLWEISSRSCVASSSAPWEPTVDSHGSRPRRPRWRHHGTKPSWPRRPARLVRRQLWGRPKFQAVETVETEIVTWPRDTKSNNNKYIEKRYLFWNISNTFPNNLERQTSSDTEAGLGWTRLDHLWRECVDPRVFFESAAPGLQPRATSRGSGSKARPEWDWTCEAQSRRVRCGRYGRYGRRVRCAWNYVRLPGNVFSQGPKASWTFWIFWLSDWWKKTAFWNLPAMEYEESTEQLEERWNTFNI